jgi:hypothetical protein
MAFRERPSGSSAQLKPQMFGFGSASRPQMEMRWMIPSPAASLAAATPESISAYLRS